MNNIFSIKSFLKTALVITAVISVVLPSISFAQYEPQYPKDDPNTPSDGMARFNTLSQDKPTLRVSNYTQNPGCNTCWSSSTNAASGEIVSFVFYYHNTSGYIAQNTNLRISFSQSNGKIFASGTVGADNAISAHGSANVNITSGTIPLTITFQSSEWYPDQRTSPSSLPGGQTGSGVTSSGVNIGDIYPGWAHQGFLVVRFLLSGGGNNSSAPLVQTNPATNISQTSATLNGLVNPNSASTNYWFEYGTSQSLGYTTQSQSAGSGSSNVSASQSISGLSQNTTYYFRVVGQNSNGTTRGSILNFTTDNQGTQGSAPSVSTLSASNVLQTSATLNGSVNPNNASTSYWFEYGTSQSLGGTSQAQSLGSGSNSQNVSSSISGLIQNTTYYFRVVAQNQYGTTRGSILSFTTQNGGNQGSAPLVQTNPATNISQTSATLNGSVNPNTSGTPPLYSWFEYGTSQSLGYTIGSQSLTPGFSYQNISFSISGLLLSNTTYYFRAAAQNSYGITYGNILSFTTGGGQQGSAPSAQTNSSSNISQNSATLNGSVNPNGASTNYWFEYGTSQSLGNTTPTQSIGSGSISITASYSISGLSQNTTYYFRVVAQNQHGTTQGSILSFTTNNGGNNQGSSPYVQTTSAQNISYTYADIRGYVNPNNSYTSAWFEYGTSQSLGNSTPSQYIGSDNSQFSISYTISSLSQNTTYYFRAVGQNQYGTSYGSILSFTTTGGGYYGGSAPVVNTLTATLSPGVGYSSASAYLRGSAYPNNSPTYGWFEYGINSSSLTYTTGSQYIGNGNSYQEFSQAVNNLSSGTTYYYRAVARNDHGTSYGQILSFSTSGGNNYGQSPIVITRPVGYVYQNSTLLNGDVNPNGGMTDAWFEFGKTSSLGSSTGYQAMGSGNTSASFSFALSGLNANTTYYYRAVARNQYGTAYGQILNFTTSGYTNIIIPSEPRIIIQQPIVTGTGLSCIVLVPALNVSELRAGEPFTFTVTYKNGCGYNLSNAFLKVILPTEVDFVSTNYPFFNRDANGISYNLGVVSDNYQSAISISGIVKNSVNRGDTLIFSTVFNFNDSKGKFQSISAYLTAVVGAGKTLTASVFDAFRSLFGNWLFDLILILVVLFLIYWVFFKRDKEEAKVDPLK